MINIDQMNSSSKNVNYHKRGMLFIVGICLLIILSSSIFAGYTRAIPSYTQSYQYSIDYSGTQVLREACAEGQDFVIQVQPFGCTPAVVRTDLLEEQDVPVFCQLLAYFEKPYF